MAKQTTYKRRHEGLERAIETLGKGWELRRYEADGASRHIVTIAAPDGEVYLIGPFHMARIEFMAECPNEIEQEVWGERLGRAERRHEVPALRYALHGAVERYGTACSDLLLATLRDNAPAVMSATERRGELALRVRELHEALGAATSVCAAEVGPRPAPIGPSGSPLTA